MEDNSTFFDFALYLGYFLVIVALAAAIIMPLVKSIGNPRSLMTLGGGILGLVVIVLISYALSDSTVLPEYAEAGVTDTGSKWIGASIISMYILLGIAFISILFTEVVKFFR